MIWARRFTTGLVGKARALFHGLGPKGEYPSRLLLATTILLYSEEGRHVVEISCADRNIAERIFEMLEQLAEGDCLTTALRFNPSRESTDTTAIWSTTFVSQGERK